MAYQPIYTHWISKDVVNNQSRLEAACEAIFPRDGSGKRTCELIVDPAERPGYVKVNSLSQEPSNLMVELRARGGDNGLEPEIKVEPQA
ncbi:hypothetical protein FAUST_544 [Fusarium austroamericanum]|uniref:Uncharacterized protein n=1 Tax=Fusarium austroamericanum TaxID=282268 RepID=A0AAN6CA54_FUSAU|nr:hypothetical protein FAUST_544 [Fusarium austroamericanum]